MLNPKEAIRLSYGIRQACEATSLGRSFLYQEISEGRLPTFKVGARTLIAASDLEAWLNVHRNKSA
ncbi:MAG: helix-turn-helix domain-containing protein [Methylocystaceae bacterium]|nr:helix-turn-helix domain-containing protein [Methylocystaceae bacterium]